MSGTAPTLREACLSLLESPSLEEKLIAPLGPGGAPLDDRAPGPACFIDAPARADHLRMRPRSEPLPKLKALGDPAARAVCLERFAHHELQAVELFAWALLAFPEAQPALRRGLVQALVEEQRHLALYLARLDELGSGLGQGPLGDYFWRHVPAAREGGMPAFLAAMGLTLEQANLDFSLLYRDAFRRAGDEASAEAMQQVHDDEVGHVALAVRWLPRLTGRGLVESYDRSVPFPLRAARAKGRRFDVAARRRAGLPEDFIEHVRAARP